MDYIVRATAADGSIRAFAGDLTHTVAKAAKIHGLYPVAAAALGRTIIAAALMASDMKNEKNSVSIIIKGGGPLGNIVVVAKADGTVKGYVDNPHVDLPLNKLGKLDVGGAVGIDGKLTVIKDLGLKEPYAGQIELVTGEIAEDLANYFWVSEQQPSVTALGVLVNPDLTIKAAGGYIIQPLPGTSEDIIDKIETQLARIPSISTMIDEGASPEEVLETVLAGMEVKFNARLPYEFRCDCSKERLEGVVLSLGYEEIGNLIKADGKAELVCHYCNTKYHFDRSELERLLEKATEMTE
ncbi:MAG TPA: Hsp33 family molecular chaperone HslO [Candidatus Atribacteria bacterium]|nr:Hsp33 family molecular chaperone HslO [Candidatus Atribacteria bacterium]HPT78312.1 Hsp33 family molecular chaperone HslO [Candidatus Atribacteria bacterium]